jgi:SagB-type dehydrogenase family enzyme
MPELRDSIAQHYHERTKYSPETINAKNQPLDWDRQPTPYKDYRIGMPFDLKPYLQLANGDGINATDAHRSAEDDRWWERLSKFLCSSYGLTGMIPTEGEPHYLRSAPSAGGLYPAEIYLVSRGTPELPAGLYNYQAQNHTLMHFWENEVWTALQAACFWHPALDQTQVALVVSAVFERSAWRYHDRAYRRICLDTGHLLGNIELAGTLTDYRPHVIGGFADAAMNQLMYFDPALEGTLAVISLADARQIEGNLPGYQTSLPSPMQTEYSRSIADGDLLHHLHDATQIQFSENKVNWRLPEPTATPQADKYNFPFGLKLPTTVAPIDWQMAAAGLERTMMQRRSTRAFTGSDLTLDELRLLLDFSYHPEHYIEQGFDRAPDYLALDLVQTFVAVSGVSGLEEGCYYYAPQAQELRQIRFKNFRRELHYLCLGQDLGRDAAAIVFHTADLQAAIERFGDRAYRYLHLDAGHLGQRLNLAAAHLELGVSGIAGFFDDQVNQVLSIPDDEAVLYITTLGRLRRR